MSQLELLPKSYANSDFHITELKKYLVFGITISVGASGNQICDVQIVSDYGHIAHAPLVLFEIIDSRVSKYWQLKILKSGQIAFWPEKFFKEFFHDDLSEDIPSAIEDFKLVRKLLEEEQLW
ncbi:hypothetical protein [Ferruginibacter sp. HRS2-29]|uniref:hypothetical protein n=1 Tax=Ferruginibacter sp. HRS2-29 TaxID=2487334 RepID=UPI0020CF24A5|nr:hypothetical protein [Ferruginibacter sp. HRS2-29]